MKYFLHLIVLVAIIAGCGKKGAVLPSNTTNAITGNYVTYKILDTLYNLNSKTIAHIEIKSLTGDTAYNAPGTPLYNVKPNPGGPYNGQFAMADTLIFSSATKGTESDQGNRFPFTYSTQTKAFDDLSSGGAGSGITDSFIQINATTLEVISIQVSGGFTLEAIGSFYKKI
jgi:hypothetical protein